MVELLLKLFASFPTKLSLAINYLMLHYQYCVQCLADKGRENLSVSSDKGKEKSGDVWFFLLFSIWYPSIPPPLPPKTFFGIWQSVRFFFRILNFRHLADYQNNFRSSVGKFVIWLLVDFFVKKQENFRQKAAPPSTARRSLVTKENGHQLVAKTGKNIPAYSFPCDKSRVFFKTRTD